MSFYFISIGGSGAKVLESLTHLCAAGMFPTEEKLYVMAIDPDVGNGNLARSSAALHCYDSFQKFQTGSHTPLFKTKVELANPFVWNPTEHDKCLDDVMSYQAYKGTPIGDLYEVLYTKKERSTLLNEGFRGHPSIGAAVMAKKVALHDADGTAAGDAEPWKHFKLLVNQDAKTGSVAKIFLTGSVFGGTGAAGMPTIAKLLQRTFKTLYEEGKVLLGGGLILPYFSFSPAKTDAFSGQVYASSENFLTSTQAALKYYSVKNKEEDIYHAMYFIGDNILAPVQKFSVGSSSQENNAHIVDFYGALAAIDFFQSDVHKLKQCSYITHAEDGRFSWSDLPNIVLKEENGQQITVPQKERLAQYIRFVFSYVHLIKPVLKQLSSGRVKGYQYPWFIDYLEGLNIDTLEVKNFEEYTECFVRWLLQLEGREQHARNIDLLHPMTIASINPAKINADLFANCITGEESGVTIHELWYRLSESGCRNEYADGFGKFLRVLYDCCEKR
jgi:hypothetical protein